MQRIVVIACLTFNWFIGLQGFCTASTTQQSSKFRTSMDTDAVPPESVWVEEPIGDPTVTAAQDRAANKEDQVRKELAVGSVLSEIEERIQRLYGFVVFLEQATEPELYRLAKHSHQAAQILIKTREAVRKSGEPWSYEDFLRRGSIMFNTMQLPKATITAAFRNWWKSETALKKTSGSIPAKFICSPELRAALSRLVKMEKTMASRGILQQQWIEAVKKYYPQFALSPEDISIAIRGRFVPSIDDIRLLLSTAKSLLRNNPAKQTSKPRKRKSIQTPEAFELELVGFMDYLNQHLSERGQKVPEEIETKLLFRHLFSWMINIPEEGTLLKQTAWKVFDSRDLLKKPYELCIDGRRITLNSEAPTRGRAILRLSPAA